MMRELWSASRVSEWYLLFARGAYENEMEYSIPRMPAPGQ